MKKALNHIEEAICAAILLVMTVLTFSNVLSRYWLHASISFTDEITTALFVFLCTMGTALAVKRNAHLGLSILTDRLSPPKAALFATLGNLLGALLAAILLYTGLTMVRNQIANSAVTLSLQIPAAIYGSFIPIGMAFTLVRFLENVLKNWRTFQKLNHPDEGGQPEAQA